MKITLFGLAGTGTSTVAKLFSKTYDHYYGYTGAIFRAKAKELGMTIYEFDQAQKGTFQYDKEIDEEVAQFGRENEDFIFEGRLAWHFIPDSLKIKLICDDGERFRRVTEREEISVDEAKKKSEEREFLLEQRYLACYPNLPYPPEESVFDLIIDTTSKSPEEIVNIIAVKAGLEKK